MPAAAWIAIAVAVSGVMWAILWWLIQRHIGRTDAIEHALLHPEGFIAKMRVEFQGALDVLTNRSNQSFEELRKAHAGFLTQEDLDLSANSILDEVRRQRADGTRREQRIVDAIIRGRNEVREFSKDLHGEIVKTSERSDAGIAAVGERVNAVNERVDRVNDRAGGAR